LFDFVHGLLKSGALIGYVTQAFKVLAKFKQLVKCGILKLYAVDIDYVLRAVGDKGRNQII
jgi:hypothetical protein